MAWKFSYETEISLHRKICKFVHVDIRVWSLGGTPVSWLGTGPALWGMYLPCPVPTPTSPPVPLILPLVSSWSAFLTRFLFWYHWTWSWASWLWRWEPLSPEPEMSSPGPCMVSHMPFYSYMPCLLLWTRIAVFCLSFEKGLGCECQKWHLFFVPPKTPLTGNN